MAGPAVFSPAYTYVDGQLSTFLGDRLNSVIAQVSGPLRLAIVLYVMLYGVAILRGSIREPFTDFAVRSIKLGLIYMIATTAAYSSWVTQPLFNVLPNTLATAISGSGVTDIGGSFDKFLGYGGALSEKIIKGASFGDIGDYIVAGIIFLVTVVATALGFGILMIGKVALALLVAVGPIFVGCGLFSATRRFFFGWLAQGVNYLTLFALMITVFELVLALVQQQWPNIDGQTNAEVAGMLFCALCILGAIFFLQTPAIAAGIAGGASTGIADFAAAAAGFAAGSSRSTPAVPDRGAAQAGGGLGQAGRSSGGGSIEHSPSRT